MQLPLNNIIVIFVILWITSCLQFWSSLFYLPLSQRKSSLTSTVLSVPSPLQVLRVCFQGTTPLCTPPAAQAQGKRNTSQRPPCQSALAFSISHLTETPHEQTLVCLPRSGGYQHRHPLVTHTLPKTYDRVPQSCPSALNPFIRCCIVRSCCLCRQQMPSHQRGETKVPP